MVPNNIKATWYTRKYNYFQKLLLDKILFKKIYWYHSICIGRGELKKVSIVDGLITYNCKRRHKIILLIIRNVCYVELMVHNLIPTFIIWETELIMKDIPKIHTPNPIQETHTIQHKDNEKMINLELNGIFTQMPTNDYRMEFQ